MSTETGPRIHGDDLRLVRLAHRVTIAEVGAAMVPPVSRQRARQIEATSRPTPAAAARFVAAVHRASGGRDRR